MRLAHGTSDGTGANGTCGELLQAPATAMEAQLSSGAANGGGEALPTGAAAAAAVAFLRTPEWFRGRSPNRLQHRPPAAARVGRDYELQLVIFSDWQWEYPTRSRSAPRSCARASEQWVVFVDDIEAVREART